ncbi:LuxR C-terminal-related transcriptional regulator [Guptibacillus hwajinpoensis]|uniref:LuxR C-terminal-related transcriptional regulator n=1 Tax=Guptibacillus hwajinpoensis TaxID=208199 RepID=UPI003D007572
MSMHEETWMRSFHRMLEMKDPIQRCEVMIKQCLAHFPFMRASLFTFSYFTGVGEGILRVDRSGVFSMSTIREDIRRVPPIQRVLLSNKPAFLVMDQHHQLFPTEYIEAYDLTSVLIIPLSIERIAIGCVLIDKNEEGVTVHQGLIDDVMMYFQQALAYMLPPISQSPNPLSKRETEVLQYAADGYSTKEMARLLRISDFTARDYISTAIRKLQANHRAEAVAKALREKWIL